jgi:hypothetical protein
LKTDLIAYVPKNSTWFEIAADRGSDMAGGMFFRCGFQSDSAAAFKSSSNTVCIPAQNGMAGTIAYRDVCTGLVLEAGF